jgi:integrase
MRNVIAQMNMLKSGDPEIGLPKPGWQVFRLTYRTKLSESGRPLEVQKLMRHADIAMTTKYGRSSILNVTVQRMRW